MSRGISSRGRSDGLGAFMPCIPEKESVHQHCGRKVARLGADFALTVSRKCLSALLLTKSGCRNTSKKSRYGRVTDSFVSTNPVNINGEKYLGNFELRLTNLKNLKDKGLIDETEFKTRKRTILDEI